MEANKKHSAKYHVSANIKSTAPTAGFHVICKDSAPSTGNKGKYKDMTKLYVSISKFIADMHVEI